MPVVDDPRSILRCCNKVYLHELLRRAGVPTPPTRVVAPGVDFTELAEELGVPFVVKQPDGSFSSGVKKIATAEEWSHWSGTYFAASPLLVVQAFMPTDYDWRVAVLGGRPLFAARYHMASGHWQIVAGSGRKVRYGRVEAVPRSRADADVVAMACTAAGLIGDGLYGVDLKQTSDGVVVIEVNDNPNLDFGQEDVADGEVIYEDLLRHFGELVDRANRGLTADPPADRRPLRAPIQVAGLAPNPPYKAYEVVGIELEYPIVDDRLEPIGAVADVLRDLAGRPTSDVELGVVGLSNEIVDHVLELKTNRPLARLVDSELVLAELVRRVAVVLAERPLVPAVDRHQPFRGRAQPGARGVFRGAGPGQRGRGSRRAAALVARVPCGGGRPPGGGAGGGAGAAPVGPYVRAGPRAGAHLPGGAAVRSVTSRGGGGGRADGGGLGGRRLRDPSQ
jgi:hypothetical protein